ncbi:mannose-1-phosphate guanylyltransferase [soil metagenome]
MDSEPITANPAFWSVIPAGGAGTRLWPLSRSSRPKFLLPLIGDRSLLQQTVDRVSPYSTLERTVIVAGSAHAADIARQLPEVPVENIIIEPSPKGTGPAIGLAALLIRERDPNAIMGSFAADHVVTGETAFRAALETAISTAREGWLTTIGLEPTRAETGFGYIERTDERVVSGASGEAYRAAGFTEKPDSVRAQQFLDSGRYLWNASMFVWRVDRLAEELEKHQPHLSRALLNIVDSWQTDDRDWQMASNWIDLETVTIDHGIMEKVDRIAVVPAGMGWSDVGDWHGLGELVARDRLGNSVTGRSIQHEAQRCMVWSTTGRLIALVGVENLAIIDTPDALLVVNREKAQDVRKVVDQLTGELESLT